MNESNVTCILTSCGRFDLLARTLESFFKYNTYDIKEFIIYEDSGLDEWASDVLKQMMSDYPFIKWIRPGVRTGQISALDTLWSMVTTEYAMTLEDDWETLRGGFIEDSIRLLELMPDVLQVWLQPLEEHNKHPITWYPGFGMLASGPAMWSGLRFNPALKRKADYDLIAPFSKHTIFCRDKPWKSEADISKEYTRLGFKAAILPNRYIKHIGDNRHIL